MTTYPAESRPRRDQKAVWREVEEEVYICSPDGETLYTLTDVGADIWRVCDGEKTVADIAELLLAAYDTDSETLDRDLQEFLAEMEKAGLIFLVDG